MRNGGGGTKRVWKLATRSQAPSGRAPRRSSSEERRVRFLSLHRRSQRASAFRGRPGGWRTTDGRSPLVRPRTESRRRHGVDAPFGERPHRITGRTRNGPDAMGRSRPPGDREEGHLRMDGRTVRASTRLETSVPIRVQAPGVPATLRHSGDRPQVACRAAARRPFPGERTLPDRMNRLLRQPTRRLSGRDGDAIHRSRPDAGVSPSGGWSEYGSASTARTASGSGSGK